MREILYRGKRVDNGEWTYGFYFEHSIDGQKKSYIKYQTFDEGFVTNEVVAETIGQYTGLTDKNGNKIFEGDIVLFEDESPTNYEYHDCTEMRCGEIKFGDGAFYITNRIAVEMEDLLYCGELDCEVIGNIHDNPEQ